MLFVLAFFDLILSSKSKRQLRHIFGEKLRKYHFFKANHSPNSSQQVYKNKYHKNEEKQRKESQLQFKEFASTKLLKSDGRVPFP